MLPSRRSLELNELKWWSNWADLRWLDKNTYMLTSQDFPEYFFNRGGLLTCRSVPPSARKLESRFRSLGLASVIMVYETCSNSIMGLVKEGYGETDRMTVMASTKSAQPSGDLAVRIRPASDPEQWSKAYLLSFYGELGLLPAVKNVVRELQKTDSATLLEAELEGKVAGVLALYRTPRIAGIYCVGTVPKFRRRGVAGSLLSRAKEIASSERRSLVLQTLRSDGAERFYSGRGFERLYRKRIMIGES